MVIVDDITQDCLLGSDFFESFNCKIDFGLKELTFGTIENLKSLGLMAAKVVATPSKNRTPVRLETKKEFTSVIRSNIDVFSTGDFDLGRTSLIEHEIDTKDTRPIKRNPRRIPPHRQKFVSDTTDQLLEQGLIRESHGAWSSPIVLAKKAESK
ncbi:uncharacterized protein LOC141900826 [Tubulanus polymorphus]|uniref:uncharacterized protein LOC141900826 n=1 Tax=Tubulanus polymorphus TaxID=672921 RepID=UPI003DA442D5